MYMFYSYFHENYIKIDRTIEKKHAIEFRPYRQ